MRDVTEKIADFILQTKYEQIPKEVIETAKLHLLDTIGCLLAGSQEEAVSILTDYIINLGGGDGSSIIPGGFKSSAPYAALANGVSAHILDYDDYEWPSMAHPSVTVLPAVLALGEKTRENGKDCRQSGLPCFMVT